MNKSLNEAKFNEENNDNNSINSGKKTKPPTIKKFNMIKSSSAYNIDSNNNNNQIKFKVDEIRKNDLYENQSIKKEINDSLLKYKQTKICCRCGTEDVEEKKSITFSCNHISCLNCIIKDLLLLHFKNIENKDKVKLVCRCMIGSSPQIEFPDFLQKIKDLNYQKEEKHK
jgi:hypothetical protein